MNKHATWFRRAVWLGILADWVLGIPVIFAPEKVLDLLGFRQTADPVWTAFAGLLVVLLSLFYIPGAQNPYRYKFNAWFAVFARPPGVIFFLVLWNGHYPAFGLLDGFLFLIQFPLLILTMRHAPKKAWKSEATPQAPTDQLRTSTSWLRRTLWLGIIADWVLGVPSIFMPEKVLELAGLRQTLDPVWTAFAALILVLLGVAYVPGANKPLRYRANAWLAVFARPPGVVFFLLIWPGFYVMFALLDGVLFLLQMPWLIKVMQLVPERRFRDTEVPEYAGTTFKELKTAVWRGPYNDSDLPYHKGIGPTTFLQFLNDSARNMHDRRDIRPVYNKLIHANGVAYTGVWEIDQETPYTGMLRSGAKGLCVARASVAGPLIWQGARRAFGIAGKVFPNMDPDAHVWPANFVTVSHLSGSRAKHVLDTPMSNYPTVGLDPASNLINRVIFRIMDTRPGYRQLFTLSTLGLAHGEVAVTPDLMELRIADSMARFDAKDFRHEIRVRNYPRSEIVYDIRVKDFADADWRRIGSLTFTDDVISEGSDKQLHFWIPRDIPNVPQGR